MPHSVDVHDPPPPPPPSPPPFQLVMPERKPLGAAKAFMIFAAYLVSQAVAGAVALLAFTVLTGREILSSDINQMDPVLFLVAGAAGFVLGGPVVVVLARLLERGPTWGQALANLGLVRVPAAVMAKAALLGVAIALFLGFGLELIFPSPENAEGPLIQAASEPGWQRIIFVLLAIVLAPIFEEFLFRGVMYTGMARSWGKWPAGIIVTVMFGLLHIADIGGYWPALVMITLVGLSLLIVRIRTNSLLPAMVMHATYNLVQVVALYTLT
ncbi:MAG: CPBP family intramembrane glutamic endopeptidase [Actinomycetota bacterium]